MKILRLNLLAFGPFTDVALDLRDGNEGLHLIYGPNEAGKSSALRAVRQLLFGIPTQSADAFLHDYKKMRVGATLGRDGALLEFTRRKANRNTLRQSDDETPLPDATLEEWLRGVDKATFEMMFGIDRDELVRGGQAIVAGGGDVGQILFAAGSGVADLRKVEKSLEEDATNLFKPTGKKVINQALAEFAEARKQVQVSALPSSDWLQHDESLRAAMARRVQVERESESKRKEVNRLKRIEAALPIVPKYLMTRSELEAHSGVVRLPEDFGDRWRAAVFQLNQAKKDEQSAAQVCQQIETELTSQPIDTAVLAHADAVEDLHKELGSYLKAVRDRDSVLAVELKQSEADAVAILRELGHPARLDGVESLRLTAARRTRIHDYGQRFEALTTRCRDAGRREAELAAELSQARAQLEQLEAPRDPSELVGALRRAQQEGDLEKQLITATDELGALRTQAGLDLAKLSLWRGSPEDLERLATPDFEVVERFARDFEAADKRHERVQGRLEESATAIAEMDRQIQQLHLEQEVPTEEALAEARARRAKGWRLVRRAWLEKAEDRDEIQSFQTSFSGARDLADAFERSIVQADEVGDRLRREADRVATLAKWLTDRQSVGDARAQLKNEFESLREERDALEKRWRELWLPLGITPLAPAEMTAWLRKQGDLVKQARQIREKENERAAMARNAQIQRAELVDCLRRLGEEVPDEAEPMGRVCNRCAALADRLAHSERTRNDLLREAARLETELRKGHSAAAETRTQLGGWQTDWSELIGQLNLPSQTSPAEANAVLGRLTELFEKIDKADGHRRRIQAIDNDASRFRQTVERLVERLAPELASAAAELAVEELQRRLGDARTAKAKSDDAERRGRSAKEKQASAAKTVDEMTERIKLLCQEAGCAAAEELAEAERRSNKRRELEKDVDALAAQLLQHSGGASLESFVADVQAADADSLDGLMGRLEDELRRLAAEEKQLGPLVGQEQEILRALGGGCEAAIAAERAQDLLSQLERAVEQYVPLRLAARVLQRGIERYREKNQGAILRRAGELFADLTLGSFQKLRVDFTDEGTSILKGVRSGTGDDVGVEGMSEGSRDQLYLALRLASLEAYLAKNEPMPFIVDDLLINFDDDRARAALVALAQLARRTQVIFFTHHEHLVRIAEQALDKNELFVHNLANSARA